jgi:predicted regulator of Ras-like GTPase activity (Roadblock/LC7/MglB family)
MMGSFVIYEDDHRRLTEVCERLLRDANAKTVVLVDKNGQLITACGEVASLDTTSLASLIAGNVAATGGLARLIGERREFPVLFHEGERDHLHMSLVSERLILVVIFDGRSSLGLIRLRVKRTGEELARILGHLFDARAARSPAASPFAEITEDDIEKLFSD